MDARLRTSRNNAAAAGLMLHNPGSIEIVGKQRMLVALLFAQHVAHPFRHTKVCVRRVDCSITHQELKRKTRAPRLQPTLDLLQGRPTAKPRSSR